MNATSFGSMEARPTPAKRHVIRDANTSAAKDNGVIGRHCIATPDDDTARRGAATLAAAYLLRRSTCEEMARNAWLSEAEFAEKMNVPCG